MFLGEEFIDPLHVCFVADDSLNGPLEMLREGSAQVQVVRQPAGRDPKLLGDEVLRQSEFLEKVKKRVFLRAKIQFLQLVVHDNLTATCCETGIPILQIAFEDGLKTTNFLLNVRLAQKNICLSSGSPNFGAAQCRALLRASWN